MGEVCKFDELRLKTDNELLKLLNDEVELGIAAAGKALQTCPKILHLQWRAMSRQSGRTQKFHVCSRWLTAALLRRKLHATGSAPSSLKGCLRHFRVRISLSILAGKMKSRLPYSPGAKRSRESLLRSRPIQFWTDTPKIVGTGPANPARLPLRWPFRRYEPADHDERARWWRHIDVAVAISRTIGRWTPVVVASVVYSVYTYQLWILQAGR